MFLPGQNEDHVHNRKEFAIWEANSFLKKPIEKGDKNETGRVAPLGV